MAADAPPRKVVVGTMMQSFWQEYEGLDARLKTLADLIDRMSAEAKQKYDTRLDVGVITEFAVTGETSDLANRAVPIEGKVLDVMGAAARRNDTYVIFGGLFQEAGGIYSNAAVILDRQGKVAGIYRKVHAVADRGKNTCEGGVTPGKEFPVFDLDFGRIGVAICFDMSFDDVWDTYRRKGAEIVVWPTQSPQTIQPRSRALRSQCFVVSSTWRTNASIFDPTGEIIAQTTQPGSVLVDQIDLSYLLLGWQPTLQGGKAFSDKYGQAVGYRYSEAEDGGIFWSNDPKLPVMKMVRDLGMELQAECFARNLQTEQKLRGGPPSAE
jgi:predicted amidohydrolase